MAACPALGADSPKRVKAPFRVLYSNDTTNIMSCVSPFRKAGEGFSARALQATVDEVSAHGVDAHFLQPGLGVVPMWPSKVIPLGSHYAWIKERYGQGPDSFGRYVIKGGDVVAVFIERCRAQGQAAFVSFRLNDAHHKEFAEPVPGHKPGASIGMSVTPFYCDHPEYRIKRDSTRGADLVLNWAVPEVRAEKLALITELCENYDLDGMELDFLRFYSFFRTAEISRDERCAIMTAFVVSVRATLDRTARPGKRRWLCVRVPCYLAALDLLGIDLPAMVHAGVDMVNASAHYYTTQQHDLAKIRAQVPDAALYFEMCHSTWNGPKLKDGYDVFPFRRTTPVQYRTTAHLAYTCGADGVSLFNFAYYREHGARERGPFHEPPFSVIPTLRDAQALAGQPQHWFIAPGWRAPGTPPAAVPRKLVPEKPTAFRMELAPPKDGWRTDGRLRLQSMEPFDDAVLSVTLNGTALKPTEDTSEPFPAYPALLGTAETLRAWTVPANVLRPGANRLEVKVSASVEITFIDLAMP